MKVRSPRGSKGRNVSIEEQKPVMPPQQVGSASMVPESIIIPSDYVHTSSRCFVCIFCRSAGMPGLQYCHHCGNDQRDELPEGHNDTVNNMSEVVLARALRYVSTVAVLSGPRGRMSSAQTTTTG